MNLMPSRDAMERAFHDRDASFDGLFFTGVKTTGIFCRPSCPARKPLPENCEYFATVKDAMFAGYRACNGATRWPRTGVRRNGSNASSPASMPPEANESRRRS